MKALRLVSEDIGDHDSEIRADVQRMSKLIFIDRMSRGSKKNLNFFALSLKEDLCFTPDLRKTNM